MGMLQPGNGCYQRLQNLALRTSYIKPKGPNLWKIVFRYFARTRNFALPANIVL